MVLFGCVEDVQCEHSSLHAHDFEQPPFTRRLCMSCRVPACCNCWTKTKSFSGASSVPVSPANDHYYGYVPNYLAENDVAWVECAVPSVSWSTTFVYYSEDPFGHLPHRGARQSLQLQHAVARHRALLRGRERKRDRRRHGTSALVAAGPRRTSFRTYLGSCRECTHPRWQ